MALVWQIADDLPNSPKPPNFPLYGIVVRDKTQNCTEARNNLAHYYNKLISTV